MTNQSAVTVLLTVGTDSHPYDRAVRWIDAWAAANPDVRVVAQWGTSVDAVHAEGGPLLPRPELDALMISADAVVSHGGPATLQQIRAAGTMPLCIPRDPTLGEHVDDHQQRFARHQHAHGRVVHVEDEATLHAHLDRVVADRSTLAIDPEADAAGAVVATQRFGEMVEALLVGDTAAITSLHDAALADATHEDAP